MLFLDELPEFDRLVFEVLREPLESGHITVSRAAQQSEFPARFQRVAAMNPCPCGHLGEESGRCRCTAEQVHRYRARISGPLLDRIDMHVEVGRAGADHSAPGESSAIVRARVAHAWQTQYARAGCPNRDLTPPAMAHACALDADQQRLIDQAVEHFGLSARARTRLLRVARTIADLAVSERITGAHIRESLAYRTLDRRTRY